MTEVESSDWQHKLEDVRTRLESARKSVIELEALEEELMKRIADGLPEQDSRMKAKSSESDRKRGRKQKVEQDGRISSCSFEESAWDPRFVFLRLP